MARSIWNGAISFGLILVPIKVHSATEDHTVHFHQVHAKDGARIKQKRICSKEGREVPYKEVAKGYEVADGEYVMLTQEEINAAAGDSAHVIELGQFVCAADIDPSYFNRTYYLGAGKAGEDAYRLLHDALERAGRAGVGRWVFHNREYLVAVRPHGSVLTLHTLLFADELVDPGDLELSDPQRAPTERELEMAATLMDSLHDVFKPEAFTDTYRERVLELLERKRNGETIEAAPQEKPEEAPDLMAALEASLKAQAKKSKGSGSAAKSKPPKTPKKTSKARS
jgi:DNA end-binding protein Ku